MNLEFNDNEWAKVIINYLCSNGINGVYNIKEDLGEGHVYSKIVNKGVSLLFFDFKIYQSVITKWNFKPGYKKQYFLINNFHNAKDVSLDSNRDLLEGGAIFFTQNNVRRRSWMHNVQHKSIIVVFSAERFESLNNIFPLPNNSSSFLNESKSIYLNSQFSIRYRLVLKQIFNLKESNEDNISLMELKMLEIVYLFLEDTFLNVSISKKGLAIHPDDLSKMTSYIATFGNIIDSLPTLKVASGTLGMSESKFQRLFKKIFNKTFYGYILELKMNFALELLMDGSSVSRVAEETGYSSLSNFTIAFKRYFKYLPSAV